MSNGPAQVSRKEAADKLRAHYERIWQKGGEGWTSILNLAAKAWEREPELEAEAAELREELRKAKVVGKSLLEEHMIPKHLQGKFTAGPGTEGKDIIVCERCGRYVTEQVEGILETRSVWERENAELRKRVGSLEEVLATLENFLEVTATYAVSKPKRDYAEFTLKTLRADLCRQQAKLENQRTE